MVYRHYSSGAMCMYATYCLVLTYEYTLSGLCKSFNFLLAPLEFSKQYSDLSRSISHCIHSPRGGRDGLWRIVLNVRLAFKQFFRSSSSDASLCVW